LTGIGKKSLLFWTDFVWWISNWKKRDIWRVVGLWVLLIKIVWYVMHDSCGYYCLIWFTTRDNLIQFLPFFVYMPFLVFLVSNPFFFFFIVLTCSFFLWFIYIVGFLSKYKKLMTMEDFYIISFFNKVLFLQFNFFFQFCLNLYIYFYFYHSIILCALISIF